MSYHLGTTDAEAEDAATKLAADIAKGIGQGASASLPSILNMLTGKSNTPPVVAPPPSAMSQLLVPGLLLAGLGTTAVIIAVKKKKKK